MLQTRELRLNDLPPGLEELFNYRNVSKGHGECVSCLEGGRLCAQHDPIAHMRAARDREAALRNLTPLWKNANEQIDDAIIRIGREGLTIAADRIEQFGVSMPNWLGILELTSHKVGESRRAQRGMVPEGGGEGGHQDKTPYTIPIYVTWDTFAWNARELRAAELSGRPLDTDEVEQAVRNVNYAIEDAMINGADQVGGNTSPGITNTTNTFTFETSRKWDAAAKTGALILDDVLSARAVLAADKFYGPYTLYVGTTYGATLQKPFDSSGGARTIQEYLESLSFGGRNLRVRTADLLEEDTIYLVEDSNRAVDVIVGQQPVAINPAPEREWWTKWVVFACIVPRVKSDSSSNFGICEGQDT